MGGNLAFINRLVRCTTRPIDFMDYTHEGVRLVVNLAHEVGVCVCAHALVWGRRVCDSWGGNRGGNRTVDGRK